MGLSRNLASILICVFSVYLSIGRKNTEQENFSHLSFRFIAEGHNMIGLLAQKMPSKLIADTFALVTFAFVVGMFVEIALSGLTLDQSFQSRLFAIPLNLIGARPYGLYRDWLLLIAKTEDKTRITLIVIDILAFLSFMAPQYAAVLWWVGADPIQVLTACISVAVISVIVGRPYGLYMVFCRRIMEKYSPN